MKHTHFRFFIFLLCFAGGASLINAQVTGVIIETDTVGIEDVCPDTQVTITSELINPAGNEIYQWYIATGTKTECHSGSLTYGPIIVGGQNPTLSRTLTSPTCFRLAVTDPVSGITVYSNTLHVNVQKPEIIDFMQDTVMSLALVNPQIATFYMSASAYDSIEWTVNGTIVPPFDFDFQYNVSEYTIMSYKYYTFEVANIVKEEITDLGINPYTYSIMVWDNLKCESDPKSTTLTLSELKVDTTTIQKPCFGKDDGEIQFDMYFDPARIPSWKDLIKYKALIYKGEYAFDEISGAPIGVAPPIDSLLTTTTFTGDEIKTWTVAGFAKGSYTLVFEPDQLAPALRTYYYNYEVDELPEILTSIEPTETVVCRDDKIEITVEVTGVVENPEMIYTYQLQRCRDIDADVWIDIENEIQTTELSMTWTDLSVDEDTIYYRVLVKLNDRCPAPSDTILVNGNAYPEFITDSYFFCDGSNNNVLSLKAGNIDNGVPFEPSNTFKYYYTFNGAEVKEVFLAGDRTFTVDPGSDGKYQPGDYQIIVEGCPNCRDTSNVISVSFPELLKTDITTECIDHTTYNIAVELTGYEYTWDNGVNWTTDSLLSGVLFTAPASLVRIKDPQSYCVSDSIETIRYVVKITDISAPDTVCAGSEFEITVDAEGFVDNVPDVLSYQWQLFDGASFADIAGEINLKLTTSISDNTKFRVIVSGEECCPIESDTIKVEVKERPTISPSGSIFQCDASNALQLEAGAVTGGTPGYTYYWTKDGGAENLAGVNSLFHINPKAEGDYKIIVEDNFGCRDTSDVVKVLFPKLITADITVACEITGTSYSLSIAGTTAGDYEHSIDGGILWKSNAEFTGIPLTDANTYVCIKELETRCISEIVPTTMPIINVSILSPNSVCTGTQMFDITASVSGGFPAGIKSYEWQYSTDNVLYSTVPAAPNSPALTNMTIDENKYFRLIIEDNAGCCPAVSDTVLVQLSSISFDDPELKFACNISNQFQLEVSHVDGAAPITYYWIKDGGTENPATLDNGKMTIMQKNAGSYEVMAEDKNGCRDTTDAVIVSFPPEPSGISATCEATMDSYQLTITALASNYVYSRKDDELWLSTGTAFTNIPLSEPSNNVRVKDTDTECISDIVPTTMPVVTDFTFFDFRCNNETSVTLQLIPPATGSGYYEYTLDGVTWSTDYAGFSIPIEEADGAYTLTVKDTGTGCETDAFEEFYRPLKPELYPLGELQVYTSESEVILTASGAENSYLWKKNNVIMPGVTSNIYHAEVKDGVTTEYTVQAQNAVNNCLSLPEWVTVIVPEEKFETFITPFTGDGVNDVFAEGYSQLIFNRLGTLIYDSNGEKTGWNGGIKNNLRKLADPGVYFYVVKTNHGPVRGSIEVVRK